MEKETMAFVVSSTTMKRILKHKTGISRIERAASATACRATDAWIKAAMKRIVLIATEKTQRTIDVDTIQQALEGQVKVPHSICSREWCKTRLRDHIKALSPGFRWSLAAKSVLYNAFEMYIETLS